jgi:hypothetical protein
MLNFVLGSLATVLLIALLAGLRIRRWRRHRRAAFGPGAPPRWILRGLFRRLGTSPEQEAAIASEADALAAELRALREDGRALHQEVAALLGAPAFDGAALDAALATRLERLDALRARASAALGRLHAVLDQRQREVLAGILRGGFHRHAHRGGC